MKGYRILYWIAMLSSLLFGLYSGSRFSWLLFLVMAFVLLAALGINLWTVWSFSYLQNLSDSQGEKGQSIDLFLSIYNDKPFPFTYMRVKVETPDRAENRVLEINLLPKAHCSFDLKLSLSRRGEFLVGMSRLELQDMFGLLPMRFDLRRLSYYRQKSLLVLPQIKGFPIPAGKAVHALGGGRSASGRDEFAYLREWQPGDPLSRIHWKASARSQSLLTRLYEAPSGSSCLIFLDCRILSDELADGLTDCAATLAFAHLNREDSLSLSGGAEEDPVKQAVSPADLTALRQWLAVLKFDRKEFDPARLQALLSTQCWDRVYVLGGSFDPEIAGILERTQSACCYWVAEPVKWETTGDRHIRVASLNYRDLTEFLRENLVEGA